MKENIIQAQAPQFGTQRALSALTDGIEPRQFDTKAYLACVSARARGPVEAPREAYFAEALADYPIQ